jgi:hypothetical protein
MRKMLTLLVWLTLASCAPVSSPALATYAVHHITFSPGGSIGKFIKDYIELKERGTKVVIDGMCISACTLLLGIVPNEQVCITPYAQMGFHSATDGDTEKYDKQATRVIWHLYPARVREILIAKGWDGDGDKEHPDLIYVEHDELKEFYKECAS